MIPASYKPKKKFMELAISEAKLCRRPRRLSHRRGDHSAGGQARSGDCQRRQSRENFGLEHQTRGAGNAEIRFQRLRPLSARLRSVFDARALRDVRGGLRVVQNWRGGLRSIAGRHRGVWAQVRHGRLQMASLLNLLRVCFSQGQSSHPRMRRLSAGGMSETFQLQEHAALVSAVRRG